MDDNAYIEELTGIIMAFANPDSEVAKDTAKRITDWHREQGLRVVPYEMDDTMRAAAVNTTMPSAGEPPLYEKMWRNVLDAVEGVGRS